MFHKVILKVKDKTTADHALETTQTERPESERVPCSYDRQTECGGLQTAGRRGVPSREGLCRGQKQQGHPQAGARGPEFLRGGQGDDGGLGQGRAHCPTEGHGWHPAPNRGF